MEVHNVAIKFSIGTRACVALCLLIANIDFVIVKFKQIEECT